jgi:uncharacterized protein
MNTIPMFPLSILPLPGELVPLHIFEPRYRQLLQEAEADDISFGIFFNSTINHEKIGSLMRLESVIKRYPFGELDVIVKCHDIFTMDKLYRTFKSKLYPGGDVNFWDVNTLEAGEIRLAELFLDYLTKRNITRQQSSYGVYAIAQELNLELNERYTFLLSDHVARIGFLMQRIKYQMEILTLEEKSKDVFHLN